MALAPVTPILRRFSTEDAGAPITVAPGPEFDAQELMGYRVPAGRTLDLPGRGTTFVRELAGPPGAQTVMLLHGLGATAALNWFSVFEPLSRSFRVIALDHRGHGRGLRSGQRFRLADCADDVAAVADALGVERFIAAGYSMGGPIAQLIWWRHPERVEGLVLGATSRNFSGGMHERVGFAALRLVTAAAGVAGGRGRRVGIATTVPKAPAGFARFVASEVAGTDARALLEAGDALGRYSAHQWIGEARVPVAVIVTTRDHIVPTRRQRKLAESIPGAAVYELEGDHLTCTYRPDKFAEVMSEACELVATGSLLRRTLVVPMPATAPLPPAVPAAMAA